MSPEMQDQFKGLMESFLSEQEASKPVKLAAMDKPVQFAVTGYEGEIANGTIVEVSNGFGVRSGTIKKVLAGGYLVVEIHDELYLVNDAEAVWSSNVTSEDAAMLGLEVE